LSETNVRELVRTSQKLGDPIQVLSRHQLFIVLEVFIALGRPVVPKQTVPDRHKILVTAGNAVRVVPTSDHHHETA